jgi:E3 ubiquitin-protein ligase HACE1
MTAGLDPLSYFALLGRIPGLALYHREPLDAHWSTAFVKALLGYALRPEDLESARRRRRPCTPVEVDLWIYCVVSRAHQQPPLTQVDPDLYAKRVVYLRDSLYNPGQQSWRWTISASPFTDDSNDEADTADQGRASVELKPGGVEFEVTEANKAEYLQLFSEHRCV